MEVSKKQGNVGTTGKLSDGPGDSQHDPGFRRKKKKKQYLRKHLVVKLLEETRVFQQMLNLKNTTDGIFKWTDRHISLVFLNSSPGTLFFIFWEATYHRLLIPWCGHCI